MDKNRFREWLSERDPEKTTNPYNNKQCLLALFCAQEMKIDSPTVTGLSYFDGDYLRRLPLWAFAFIAMTGQRSVDSSISNTDALKVLDSEIPPKIAQQYEKLTQGLTVPRHVLCGTQVVKIPAMYSS